MFEKCCFLTTICVTEFKILFVLEGFALIRARAGPGLALAGLRAPKKTCIYYAVNMFFTNKTNDTIKLEKNKNTNINNTSSEQVQDEYRTELHKKENIHFSEPWLHPSASHPPK